MLPSSPLPPSPDPHSVARPDPGPSRSGASALLHEWFVEYNPAYLFSAALVLAGLTLVSLDLAEDVAFAGLGVAAVAEVYALALIASAAFLRRVGLRRVAVMVGLLAALYQCDLTMHVETSAYLGRAGAVAACAWVALFALKLRLLAAALELRLSRSALLVPTLGAAGLALLPQLFRDLAPDARTTATALVGFAVGATALWTSRHVTSAVGFDYRGRRAVRGTWLMWAGGALLHVAYWCVELGIEPWGLVPAAALLTTRWLRRERAVWALAVLTLALVALTDAPSLPFTALMVAIALALRALRAPSEPVPAAAAPLEPPYRGAGRPPVAEITADAMPGTSFGPADRAARERLLVGAISSLHLAAWTTLAPGGLWCPHLLVLDGPLVIGCAIAAWRLRSWQPIVPLAPLGAHLVVQLGWVTAPRGVAQWGMASIALGFAMLGAGLAASWRAQRPPHDLRRSTSTPA